MYTYFNLKEFAKKNYFKLKEIILFVRNTRKVYLHLPTYIPI